MRLIDADKLKERAIKMSTVKEHCYMKAVGTREIDKTPTIDAVPVVRCKDCRYYDTACCVEGLGWCDFIDRGTADENFCSYGERRDESDDE